MVKKMIWYPTRTMISSDAFLWIRFLYQSFSWYPKSWYLLISKIMNSPDTCGRSSWYLSRIILISVQDHEFSWYIWIIILLTVQDNKILLIFVEDYLNICTRSWFILMKHNFDICPRSWILLISVEEHLDICPRSQNLPVSVLVH